MAYKVIYDLGHTTDSIEGYKTKSEAMKAAEDLYLTWMFEQTYYWGFTGNGTPLPTDKEIEEWDTMIKDCCAYVVEEGYEDDEECREYISDERLDEMGWMNWCDVRGLYE